MDGFEGSRVAIGDTIEVANELSKKTPETNPLKKTLFGTLLKWVSDVKSVGSSTRDTGDGSPARTPEEPPQSSRNIGGCKSNTKKFTDETKRRKSAYVVPTPRSGVSTPAPKHSVSSHAHQKDLEEGPFRDLLAFRPQTPYTISTDADKSVAAMKQHCDRYRLMYLIVRLEQQQDHMRDVITSTRNYGNRQSLKLITKIKDALSKLYGTMLSIRDDDEAVYNQIGTSINDLDEFFNMVENVCSAVEDIPVERPEQGQDGLPVPGLVMTSTEGLRTFYHPGLKSVSTSQAPKLYLKEKQQMVTGRMLGAEVVPVVEKPGVAMSTVWPGLNSNDKGRQKKDIELRCLMSEIDDLMVDVGLTGGKRKKNTITYEQENETRGGWIEEIQQANEDMGKVVMNDQVTLSMDSQNRSVFIEDMQALPLEEE